MAMQIEGVSERILACAKQLGGNTLTEMLLHMVTTSHFEGAFEVIRHYMTREEAKRYVALLSRYHRAGFDTIFPPLPEAQ